MPSHHPRTSAFLAAALLLGLATPADAGFKRIDGKSIHWPTPVNITVYTDGLMGNDLEDFKKGVMSWFGLVQQVTVEFMGGDPPPNTPNAVSVVLAAPGSLTDPESGDLVFSLTKTEVDADALILGGTISIDRDALGNRALMCNLGAHEFGHILGLDDYHRDEGTDRTRAMDPDFTQNDPFVRPSFADYDMLKDHYSIAPEPASALLGCFGIFLLAGYSLRKGKRAGI